MLAGLGMRYLVRSEFIALYEGEERRFSFERLSPGKCLDVVGSADRHNMVDIRYGSKILTVFMRDVLANCERVAELVH